MVTLERKRKAIKDKLNTLTILEKCEFERRLRTILSSKLSLKKLEKYRKVSDETFQDDLNKRQKTKFKFIAIFILVILIGYFFDKPIGSSLLPYIGIIIVISIAVLEIKIAILSSTYFSLYRNFQFEIDRVTNEINQYGYFLTSDSDLFFEYDENSEKSKNEFNERRTRANVELELEILSFMNLEVELNYGY